MFWSLPYSLRHIYAERSPPLSQTHKKNREAHLSRWEAHLSRRESPPNHENVTKSIRDLRASLKSIQNRAVRLIPLKYLPSIPKLYPPDAGNKRVRLNSSWVIQLDIHIL
jgi:hypothetical protein